MLAGQNSKFGHWPYLQSMPSSDHLSPEERIRIQNELTKSDLTDKHGAAFEFVAENSEDFTPKMEQQFLQNIARIENGGTDAYVPIRSLISKKAISVAAVKAQQENWEEACNELLQACITGGVMTEQPDWISPRGWYAFLSTDFLDHTIPPPPPLQAGATQRHMVGAFYDQIRQDSPETMLMMTSNLLLDILNVTEAFASTHLFADEVRNGQELQSRKAAMTKINAWREKWSTIEPGGFNPGGPMRGPDGATYFRFECSFKATPISEDTDQSKGKVTLYDGDGVVQFISVDKHLEVVGLMMPGFEL